MTISFGSTFEMSVSLGCKNSSSKKFALTFFRSIIFLFHLIFSEPLFHQSPVSPVLSSQLRTLEKRTPLQYHQPPPRMTIAESYSTARCRRKRIVELSRDLFFLE